MSPAAVLGAVWSFWISSSVSASAPYRPRAIHQAMAVPLPRQRVYRAAAEWGGLLGVGVVAPKPGPPIAAVVLPLPVSSCVTSVIAAAFAAWVTAAVTLAAGASFGKKVKSDARALAVSGVMASGAGMGPASVTVTRWNAPTLTAGPTGLPVV